MNEKTAKAPLNKGDKFHGYDAERNWVQVEIISPPGGKVDTGFFTSDEWVEIKVTTGANPDGTQSKMPRKEFEKMSSNLSLSTGAYRDFSQVHQTPASQAAGSPDPHQVSATLTQAQKESLK